MEKKYNYFYKITNNLNGKFYFGIHSTDNLNDGYMGSGKRLPIVYKKYGIENFSKEILKYFNTRKEALEYESEMVTETLVNDVKCYNLITGGGYFHPIGKVCVLDETTDKCIFIDSDEYYSHKDKYKTPGNGMVYVKCDKENKYHRVNVNEYNCNKEKYTTPSTNSILVKDKNGNIFKIKKDDKRYLSGEVTNFWKGRHHSEETKQKISQTSKTHKCQQGEKNSQFGTCWITKDGINKKIRKDELEQYLSFGWCKGRKIQQENDKISFLNKEDIIELRMNGFTWIDIAKKMNVSEETIRKFKSRNNIA